MTLAEHVLVTAPSWLARAVGTVAGGEVVAAVPTRRPELALTVDDGPHPATTPRLLEVLAAHGATATFFLVGERAREHPDLVAAIAAAGHELGNHLGTDEPSVFLAEEEFERQLDDVHALLSVHGEVSFFRPGSGWFTPSMLRAGAARGYRCALGSPGLAVAFYADPRTARATGDRLARWARPGAVVVLHEGSPERARVGDVADRLLTGLRGRGLRALSLTGLSAPAADG